MIRQLLAVRFVPAILLSFNAAIAQTQISSRPSTPAEGLHGLGVFYTLANHGKIGVQNGVKREAMSDQQIRDSMQARAVAWINTLQADRTNGIQLDPMGALSVIAGRDILAQQQFSARLASPGLSVPDKAYTLVLAIRAFSKSASDSSRMRIAESYNALLRDLPVSAVAAQFDGRVHLAFAYGQVGNGSGVIEHMTQAFALIPTMPFEERGHAFIDYDDLPVILLANVWAGKPDGRKKIDSLKTRLLEYARATPAQISSDSGYAKLGRAYTRKIKQVFQLAGYLGLPAPPITGHFWINTAPPKEAHPTITDVLVKRLDDGIIRVIEYGHRSCLPCMQSIPVLERLEKKIPNIEVWFEDHEDDSWGADRCTPQEKAQNLTREYLQKLKFSVPIALWIGPRIPDIDGGTKQQESPSTTAYGVEGSPMFVITDGKGVVRFIYEGYSQRLENVLLGVLQYLTAETAGSAER